MKSLILPLVLLVATSCIKFKSTQHQEVHWEEVGHSEVSLPIHQQDMTMPEKKNELNDSLAFQKQMLAADFTDATYYRLGETMVADLNGDGFPDSAVYRKTDETSGIIINHGQSGQTFEIGFGEPFAHFKDLNWVDFWALVKDTATFEILFSDSDIIGDSIIQLDHPAIALEKEEVGGGLITFKDGHYIWIHQTD